VPFDLSLALRDLSERSNPTRCEVLDPAARFGYGEENGVAGLWLERRLDVGLMQNALDRMERRCAPGPGR
jgi:hypothetical protein